LRIASITPAFIKETGVTGLPIIEQMKHLIVTLSADALIMFDEI
jgi:hypothetical protein